MGFEIEDDGFDADEYLRSTVEPAQAPEPAASLPVATALPKVKLDKLELPNGFRIDPDEWGIDLDYAPSTTGSTFATDLEDDEPVHVVEVPAELREFMNSEKARELSPDEMKSLVEAALLDAANKAVARFKNSAAAPVVAAIKPKDRHSAIKRGTVAVAVLLFVLLFSWKTAFILFLVGLLVFAGIYFWKNQSDDTRNAVEGWRESIRALMAPIDETEDSVSNSNSTDVENVANKGNNP